LTDRPGFYANLALALGAMLAGIWLGRSEAVFLALGLLIFTSMHEQWRP
jgi:hypothetical protein